MAPAPDRLILVRHALTVQDPGAPSYEWGLAEGQGDACLRLADRMREFGPGRVLTSTEPKATATGELLARRLSLAVEAAPGLEEHHRQGVAFERDPAAWREKLRELFTEPDRLVLGRETGSRARQRFTAAVERELARRPGERLVLVSHASVMTLFLSQYNEFDQLQFWTTIGMPEAWLLELPGYRLLDRLRP